MGGASPSDDAIPDRNGRRLTLRIVTMPRETNPHGTIFGGVVLSYVDQAAMVEALRHAHCTWVTASMERVDFIAPVHLGDILELYTETMRTGTKSVTVCVECDARRRETGELVQVTVATVTMVALDHDGRPVPFREAPPPKSAC
jgi:acyl-CoA thioesterase YciA